MSKVKNKNVLKKIAREWGKSILLACSNESFWESQEYGKVSQEEADYIVHEVHKIANKLIEGKPLHSIYEILDKYFDYE